MIKIRRYEAADVPRDQVEQLTRQSFFASDGFMDLWRYAQGNPVFWVARKNDQVAAVLPGVEFGKNPMRRFQAMPDGCYGRLFIPSDYEDHRPALSEAIVRGLTDAGYVKAYLYDFYHSILLDRSFMPEPCSTSLVDTGDPAWLPPDKTLQSELRKAEREGVSVTKFNPEVHFDRFVKLMKETEARHDRAPKYTDAFFKALALLAADDKRVIWWWCEHEGQAVTSHINFVDHDMIINWQVYFDKQFSFLKANQYFLLRLAREVSSRGLSYLNLGASPPEAEGLTDYKEKWGGATYRYNCYSRKSFLGRLL